MASPFSVQPGIVGVFRRHISLLLLRIVIGLSVLFILLVSALVARWPANQPFLVGMGVPTLWMAWAILDWGSTAYIINAAGRFIVYRELPIFGRMHELLLPLQRTAVSVRQTGMGRILNYGDVQFSLDGQSYRYAHIGNFRELTRLLETFGPGSQGRP